MTKNENVIFFESVFIFVLVLLPPEVQPRVKQNAKGRSRTVSIFPGGAVYLICARALHKQLAGGRIIQYQKQGLADWLGSSSHCSECLQSLG